MKKTWLINLTIVCTILGLLLSWQYNSFRAAEVMDPNAVLRENIIDNITALEANIQDIEEEISELRSQLDLFQENEIQDAGTLSILHDYLHFQRSLTSLTPVSGPGITIILNDNTQGWAAAATDPANFRNADLFIIHDKNLLYLVNDLRAAGARAISINNQRLTASSAIRCVGTMILVNGIPMAPPYEIRVLSMGDPEELRDRILLGNEIPSLMSRNFPVQIEVGEIEIPEYRGSFRPIHLEMEIQ